MPKIRLKVGLVGLGDRHDEVEVAEDRASRLIENGYAEPVDDVQISAPPKRRRAKADTENEATADEGDAEPED